MIILLLYTLINLLRIKNVLLMKKTLLPTFIFFSIITYLTAQKVRIAGSDTMLPLSQMEAYEFMQRNIDASLIITGGGSAIGIASLLDNRAEIAQSARELTKSERNSFKKMGKTIIETTIAWDALAIIVHPSNPVTGLTHEQLREIFSGQIDNWKQVGGEDMPISIYSRELNSGTHDFFQSHVLDGKDFTASALILPATGAIVQSVSQQKNAIGYIGLGYLEKTIKPLLISYDGGKNYYKPCSENVKNKLYPISRPLFYYYYSEIENTVNPFINFVMSITGQRIVEKAGYVPVK